MITDWTSFIPKMEQLLRRLTGKKHFPDNDERLEMLFQKMQSEHYLEQKIQAQQRFDYRQAEAAFLKLAKPHKQRLLIWRWAAILLLPLSMAAGFFFLHNNENRSNKPQTTQMALNDKHVYLLTSTQKTYDLTTGTLPSGLDSHIKVGDKTLNYKETANNTDSLIEKKAEIHTLVIPRGGEYSITLPDKTHIWLNADSRISYPVYFSGNTRKVTICGEAYFKVAKQEGKPFIVHTERGSITVWGTEFNVKAYANEEDFTTTLVTGSVSCTLPSGEEISLQPQEQLVYKPGKTPVVQKIDPLLACGWKDGLFVFKNKRLEEITQQIVRWFDIQVCYLDEEAKNLHFSGDLNRFQDINSFINLFKECDEINIRFENNIIYIQSI